MKNSLIIFGFLVLTKGCLMVTGQVLPASNTDAIIKFEDYTNNSQDDLELGLIDGKTSFIDLPFKAFTDRPPAMGKASDVGVPFCQKGK